GTMQSDVDSVVNTLDAQVRQRIDAMQNDVDTTINTFDTEVKQKIGTMQNDVNSVITTFDTQMRQKIGTMQNDVDSVVNTLDAQVRQKIDTMQNGVDMAINTLDTQVSDKISAVQDEVNGRVAGLQESLQTAERTKAELQAFQAQTDEQIAAVRSNIEHLKEEVSTVYGAKQEELLNTMETQIDKYRANLEYRLRQLEKTESDIDVLGENLRQSLMQVEGRVNDTFSAYTAAQEQQQADFAQRVKDKNDDIAEQIALLASQVNELKATASENVSATLKDFEENFGMDLRRRSDDIEERLNAWKQRLDTELIALTGDYEEKRRELETKYLEELKERIEELEAQGREQTQRYETGISTTLDDINRRVTNTEQTVNAFIDKANIDLQSVTDSFNKLLESNFSAYGQRINEVIAKAQQETEERLAAIEQTVHEHKETHKSNIDTMRGDLQTWQKLLKSQFDDSKELVIKQLTSLRDTANLRIEEIKAEFEQNLAAFKNSAYGKQVEINAGMDVLQKQVAAALADYETRSAQILDEQQNMYEEMLQETKRRIDEQTSNSEKTVRDLREQIQKITDKADRLETDMTMRMQSDAADLQTRFSEIDQQVKAFASQMQVYQTADKLQAKLDAEISKLNNDLAKVDTYQPAVQRLLASFGQLQGMNEDASNKLARFEAQKAHIDSLNTKFDRLLSMSNNMDAKIQELHTTNDDLQNVQIAVRKFQDTLGDISNHYDRLEKKQEVIEQVTADVDKSFDNLKELERRMDDAVRQSATIPEALKGIQRDIDTLMSNTDKVNDAVDKIASIESVLSETEQRIQQVQTARTGIAGVETRLQNLDKEIERKMGVLLRATQADLEKNPGQVAHGITPQDREAIVQLKKQGWTVDEIARRMHRSVSEVELILEMPSD
ncbi:MAG: helix-turn-helix domain-containing protein, partial [Treponema sp.]|nr:helix-turn-helix domain-containing protein [Treponema sp.]